MERMKPTSEILTSCSLAFKEWACVVESLGQGLQSLIIRKGGIHEKTDGISPGHSAFVLFPTFSHQREEDLTDLGRVGFERLRRGMGLSEPDTIPLCYLAKLQQVVWMDRLEEIAPLAALQALNAEALEKRFHYGELRGFSILVVRIYLLDKTIFLPRLPAYAGCRSWISLASPLEISAHKPVLEDADFKAQCNAFTDEFGEYDG